MAHSMQTTYPTHPNDKPGNMNEPPQIAALPVYKWGMKTHHADPTAAAAAKDDQDTADPINSEQKIRRTNRIPATKDTPKPIHSPTKSPEKPAHHVQRQHSIPVPLAI